MPEHPVPPNEDPVRPPVATDPGTGRVEREFTVVDRSQLQQVVRRFLRHRVAVGSSVIFLLLILFAFVGPLVWKYKYNVFTSDNSVPPSWKHPFGTDNLGYDGLAAIMRGTQQSIKIALCIALLATTVGTLWGVIAGYYGGIADSLLMRVADLILTIPALALAAALANSSAARGGSSR